ncbi:unnamed protein product [Darwinula stevensoni]|uniref:Armadillo repeat-containing protein 2 n=1 Tax=Darwinula stevensoni TaxID=69355 RepID=A0A7R8X1V1_9CRUS|nr:unnamed protein product [Darwinula stevensoni]CAG0880761.1 unnamed protein product [Darwinula stevensoni]
MSLWQELRSDVESRSVTGSVKVSPRGHRSRDAVKLPAIQCVETSSNSASSALRRASLGQLPSLDGRERSPPESSEVRFGREVRSGPSAPRRTPHFPDLVLTSSALVLSLQGKKGSRENEVQRPANATDASDASDPIFDKHIKPLLRHLSSNNDSGAGDEGELTECLRTLYSCLSQHGYFGNSKGAKWKWGRCQVLKALNPLIERCQAPALVQLARIFLAVNTPIIPFFCFVAAYMKGIFLGIQLKLRGQNLVSSSKLVLRIARSDRNDQLFLEGNVLDLFLDTIGGSSPLEEAEALIYAYGALKCLTSNDLLLHRLLRLGLLDLLVLHLKLIAAKKEEKGKVEGSVGAGLFQLTAVLRNVAGDEYVYHQLIASGAVKQITRLLSLFHNDIDVVSNLSRVFSVLSTSEECCDAILAGDEDLMKTCTSLLKEHPSNSQTVVRIGYALGNLVAFYPHARDRLHEAGALEVLLDLLSVYLRKDLNEGKEATKPGCSEGSSGNPSDVIIKVVRVVANMSISPKVGPEIGRSHRCLDHLLNIVRHKDVCEGEETRECISCALTALNNISFYAQGSSQSVLVERATEITELFEELLELLEVRSADVVFGTAGVLVNMMNDVDRRQQFIQQRGLPRLLGVLRDVDEGDWELGSLACQVIWNACAGVHDLKSHLGENYVQELVLLLEDLIEEEENDDSEQKSAFCKVATQLLERLDPTASEP